MHRCVVGDAIGLQAAVVLSQPLDAAQQALLARGDACLALDELHEATDRGAGPQRQADGAAVACKGEEGRQRGGGRSGRRPAGL